MSQALNNRLTDARENLQNRCQQILLTYREVMTQDSSQSRLPFLPETLQLLPYYTLSILKNACIRPGTDVRPDERLFTMCQFSVAPLHRSVSFDFGHFIVNVLDREQHFDLCRAVYALSKCR